MEVRDVVCDRGAGDDDGCGIGFGWYRIGAQRSPRGRGDPDHGGAGRGEDEVSAVIAAVFSAHGQGFQALSAQAAAFHTQFVQALTSARGAYAAAEAANASPLAAVVAGAQGLAVFSPVAAATGRPLIGNGANATTPGGNGGDGGILFGNGGNGGPVRRGKTAGTVGRRACGATAVTVGPAVTPSVPLAGPVVTAGPAGPMGCSAAVTAVPAGPVVTAGPLALCLAQPAGPAGPAVMAGPAAPTGSCSRCSARAGPAGPAVMAGPAGPH